MGWLLAFIYAILEESILNTLKPITPNRQKRRAISPNRSLERYRLMIDLS